jgi:hypothetical protein
MKFEKKDYQNIFFSYISMQEPIFSLMIKIIPEWCMDEVLNNHPFKLFISVLGNL